VHEGYCRRVALAIVDELSDFDFIAAWDYEETPDEDDEEVESLNEGFHLDMAQESDKNCHAIPIKLIFPHDLVP
jgi:hypothetical protein